MCSKLAWLIKNLPCLVILEGPKCFLVALNFFLEQESPTIFYLTQLYVLAFYLLLLEILDKVRGIAQLDLEVNAIWVTLKC